MTAQLAPSAVFRSWDNLGLPLVGGKLNTYAAGTTNPQATYVDSTQTTQNTNPVILNFRGEAFVWLDPTLTYKFVLTDAFNNLIWTEDNIPGSAFISSTGSVTVPANLIPVPTNTWTLGNATNSWANVYLGPSNAPVLDPVSGNIGYYARTAAEIAAGVTPTNYAYAPYSAQRYGFSSAASAAVNTTALQNCFNAMAQAIFTGNTPTYSDVTNSGPLLFLPDGTYHINAAITIPSYVLIRANNVILIQDTAGTDHLVCSQGYRLDIEGITFFQGRHAFNISGINLDTSRVRIARCEFQTGSSTDYAILLNQQTCNTLIEDCRVTNSPLFANVNGDFCTIRNCWVNGYLFSTGLKPNNTDSVANNARVMQIEGGSWVPESSGSGSTGSRWISNRGGLLSIIDVQFGSEGSGGLPIVYEFGNCAQGTSPFLSVSGTIIKGGQIACGNSGRADRGVINLQGSVPAVMEVLGSQFVAFGQIISSQGFTSPTLATWLASNIAGTNYKFAVRVEDVGQEPTVSQLAESVPPELLPFARISYGPRGSYPGFTLTGPLNQPVTPYLPDWTGILGQVQEFVCGQQRSPVASTYFNAISVTKTANSGATSCGGAVIELDVCSVHSNGGVEYTQQALYRITLIAGGVGNNIGSVVDLITHNDLAIGGAALGNKLLCQVNGAIVTPTVAQIQLQLNTAIGTSAALTWRAKLISGATGGGGVAQMFNITSF